MKKILIAFMVVLFAVQTFPQISKQNPGTWNRVNRYDEWKVRKNITLADTFYVNAGDTVYSEVLLTWPWMSLHVTAADTVTTDALDSTKVRVDFFQWDMYRNAYTATDSARFTFVGSLVFHGNELSLIDQTSIPAAGGWSANITDNPIMPAKYFRYRLIGLSGNRVLSGGYILMWMSAWGG